MNLKYRNKIISNTIFFISFCLPILSFAQSSGSEEELLLMLSNIHTMQATFKQFMTNNSSAITIGRTEIERPGKFRWEITQPNKQLIIIDGKQLLIYDIDLAQVTKRKVDYKNPTNPAMLLSGNANTLKQVFKITKLKQSGATIWFELKPKNKSNSNNNYQWIRICFIADKLSAMYIFDNFDQQSEIHFANVVINSKISKDKFVLIIPSKVDVVDEK